MITVRHIGWCPVCQRDIKVRARLLVHHGYQRPGVGYIIGDCPGVGHEPYELGTGAAAYYLERIVTPRRDELAHTLRVLTRPSGPPHLKFQLYDPKTGRTIRDASGQPVIIAMTRDEANDAAAQFPSYDNRYSWERQLQLAIVNTESHLKYWHHEEQRIEQLIATWSPKPLRTIEEETQRQEQSRAERERARAEAKNAKVAIEDTEENRLCCAKQEHRRALRNLQKQQAT